MFVDFVLGWGANFVGIVKGGRVPKSLLSSVTYLQTRMRLTDMQENQSLLCQIISIKSLTIKSLTRMRLTDMQENQSLLCDVCYATRDKFSYEVLIVM